MTGTAANMTGVEPTVQDLGDLVSDTPDTALGQAGVLIRKVESASIELRELTGVTLLRVHSLQLADTLVSTLAAAGIPLPARVNSSLGDDPAALCLAPHEWLLFSEFLSVDHLLADIQPVIDPQLTALIDLSASAAVFRLSGGGAPFLLSKLSGLDFHAGVSLGAHCARTRLQQAALTLHYHRPGGQLSDFVFDLILDRSVARYAWQLLIASMPHAEELNRNGA